MKARLVSLNTSRQAMASWKDFPSLGEWLGKMQSNSGPGGSDHQLALVNPGIRRMPPLKSRVVSVFCRWQGGTGRCELVSTKRSSWHMAEAGLTKPPAT